MSGLGRAGRIHTPHGDILTPAFIPVGTKATIKALTPEQVNELGAQAVLANTYHLFLQPGDELVAKAGGLHKFMNWHKPIVTDSGGFQVFSLGAAYGKEISKVVKITDPSLMIPERFDDSDAPKLATIDRDGVSFKSHLDGSMHYISPEKSIQIQHNLGADIIFAFDECTSPAEDDRYQSDALMRTHAWAKRCLEEHVKLSSEKIKNAQSKNNENEVNQIALFGIVQGGRNESLRKESAKIISEMKVGEKTFDGFGIGGSFAKEDMSSAVKWVNDILPEDKPRHLLGIGEPEDLFMGVENGVDMFDCVAPTRNARNGTLYTKSGKVNILNAQFREDFAPLEDDCGCYTCQNYTRAYLSHLYRSKEMLAGTLGTIHNLYFIANLVKDIRSSIMADSFAAFKVQFLGRYIAK
ncbi:MAG: tRNA guanosine(34) transglycosylase Tgt [Candidatus Pacebacteria bacterium]|nr:tRNA guanosine(34) transglycosylase Tgt [Candidatus Paceibacterota bacterium]MBP9851885.1 tRNA guanosine(34) transglycosylase Tgt [Candidatus Paceibacterota bacterium]